MIVLDLFSVFLGTDCRVYALFSLKKSEIQRKNKALFYKEYDYQRLTPILPYKLGFIQIYLISKKSLGNNSLQSSLNRKKTPKKHILTKQRLSLKLSK